MESILKPDCQPEVASKRASGPAKMKLKKSMFAKRPPPPELAIEWSERNEVDLDLEQYCDIWRKTKCRAGIDSDPFISHITNARCVAMDDDGRRVLHCEFSLPKHIQYSPGDLICVLAHNSDHDVDRILKVSDTDGELVFRVLSQGSSSLPELCSARLVLQQCRDLRAPISRAMTVKLSSYCSEEERSVLLSSSSAAPLSLLSLLDLCPSCSPPFSVIIDSLPVMLPRYYSISSSPASYGSSAHVVFTLLEHGICTQYLHHQISSIIDTPHISGQPFSPVPISIFLRQATDFKLPDDVNRSIIMVATGTGLAPFRSFLQHRQFQISASASDLGHAYLFFGCRHPHGDFLYHEELDGFVAEGALTQLVTAFSREDPENKVYVQDRLIEHGQMLYELIVVSDAVVYVCGDGRKMAKDVNDAYVRVLMKYGSMDQNAASDYIKKMVADKRYLQDIWS